MNDIDDIVSKLAKAMHEWTAHTGQVPKRMFLGDKEHSALLRTMSAFMVVNVVGTTDANGDRIKFHNLLVFEVDAASHISFGWDGDSPCG